MEDPFVSSSAHPAPRESHRYSPFDTQLFSLNASSPAQAKRALEAHLAETERRLEEMSKLGTALVDQQRQLEEQLKEVEQQQHDGEMGPELRQKLADLEREYAEIGRETARAFLAPKRPGAAMDEAQPVNSSIDQKSPLNPAIFASLASNSPSKVSVPSRKQRNQPSNRVHDIEFATEISTSLLAQVRQLQALLSEREETLKNVNLEKSRLELEAEGYAQRIRVLDDSEQRYKDENWALETQTHELMNTIKDATEREERLKNSLSTAKSERNAVERELEELKHANTKLVEDHLATQKATDAELHLLRRNLNSGDLEKSALQKKLQELTSQNQELAKVVALRIRQFESQGARDVPEDDDEVEREDNTPDNSPPVSPNKFTPRHGHLESETLKSSLGHAHRMIQNLKSTIHREKTEKIELKRMLQDARDEVEQRRLSAAAPNAGGSKRIKKKEDSFRKPARPDLLGAGRKEQSFVELHDTDWEDNAGQHSPTRVIGMTRERSGTESSIEPNSAYATAAEDGFETADERGITTESEEFQTGLESMADDSSDSADLTETEHSIQRTPRPRIPSTFTLAKAGDRSSYISSASTSDDEAQIAGYSPGSQFLSRPRVRSKRSGVIRRIRPSGEALMASTSRPTSARSSPAPSFEQDAAGQSLFAELAELEDGDDTEVCSEASTPRMIPASDSRRPSDFMLGTQKSVMVDSGMMTDPWEPTAASALSDVPTTPKKDVAVDAKSLDIDGNNVPTPPKMAWDRSMEYQHSEVGTQADATELSVAQVSCQETAPSAPKWPELNVSYINGQVSCQETAPSAPKWPELDVSHIDGRETVPVKYERAQPELNVSCISSQITDPIMATKPEPEPLEVSMISTQHTAPRVHEPKPVELPQLTLSDLLVHHTEPVHPHFIEPEPEIVRELSHMTLSSIFTHHATSPVHATFPEELKEIPEFGLSSLSSQQTEPITPHLPEPVIAGEPVREVPQLAISSLLTHSTVPVAHVAPVEPVREMPQLAFSTLSTHSTEPVVPVQPVREVPQLAFSTLSAHSTEPVIPVQPVREMPQLAFSSLSTRSTEPVVPVQPVREVPQLDFSTLSTHSTEPVVPIQPVQEVPHLAFSSLSTHSTAPVVPVQPVRELPQLAFSSLSTRSTEPVVPVKPVQKVSQLAFSPLFTHATEPIQALPHVPEPVIIKEATVPEFGISSVSSQQTAPRSVERRAIQLPTFSSLHFVETLPTAPLPHHIPSMHELSTQTDEKAAEDIIIFEDEARDRMNSWDGDELTKTGLALSDISGNALPQSSMRQSSIINFDQGSQTILSSKQIDQILMDRDSARPIYSRERPTSPRDAAGSAIAPKVWPTTFRRPESATSRASNSSAHPPLPADHREMISAAEKKSIDLAPSYPMGPPMAPASSHRHAPRTPNEQQLGTASIRTMSTQPHLRRGSQSNMSRRSSMSSFASEVEERFNPQSGTMPNAYGPNTDPRMIQAITQTMIGEFLWKYTRRTASNDKMTSTRHRRYFWVHPYTRTLYWSEQDPQTAGKNEIKTKSVPIEAVRVVADDNPYPPGLHCRSLEVQSPGRKVRFTASTSQRHDTWYNALQYLLVRENDDKCVEPEHSNVTLDDIDEFNPGFRSASRQSYAARMSLSSYNSRTVRQSRKTQHRAASAMSIHSNATSGTPGRTSPALSSPGMKTSLQVPDDHPRSSSRLSTILNSSIRGSIASMKGRHSTSIQSDSIRGQDSIEDLARQAEEEEERLENVRACCDGKHDVGSLSHRSSRFSPRMERHHHLH